MAKLGQYRKHYHMYLFPNMAVSMRERIVNPTCRFSLLTDMCKFTNQYWTLSLSDHFWGINVLYSCKKRSYRIWGLSIIYLGTRHQIVYRVGFTTAKLLKSGQYQKILKISALALQHFLILATFSEFNCIISIFNKMG